jgi:hypothetical protein
MGKEKLLAFGLGRRLLNPRPSNQLFTPDNLFSPAIAGDNQAFSCRHHNHQMIHTIPNSVNLFLLKQYARPRKRRNGSEYRFRSLDDYLAAPKGIPGEMKNWS